MNWFWFNGVVALKGFLDVDRVLTAVCLKEAAFSWALTFAAYCNASKAFNSEDRASM